MKKMNYYWKKTFLSMFFLLGFCATSLYAQESITGLVKDNLGVPLPGVSIIIKDKASGTLTDFDGNYSIKAEKGDALLFSYVGYTTRSIIVSDQTTINVELEEDVNELDEVVLVGYGTLEKKELTGSQVSLKSEDINKVQAVSFEEALQGKASGVLVTSSQGGPGDAAKIQIRGATSINASSAPLYVIDGVEIDGDIVDVGGGEGGGSSQSSPLSLIDPNTIESMEILKDASATAIYGSRGANGVVIIKTKNGQGNKGKTTLTMDVSTGVQAISNHIDLLGAQEYVDFYNELYFWNPAEANTVFLQKAFRDDNGNDLPLDSRKADGTPRFKITDWRDEVFREAIINKYSLGVRKGSADSWFSGNLSYTDQEGIIKNSDYQRIQVSVNTGANISPKLQVGFQANGGRSDLSGVVSAAPEQGGTGSTFGIVTNLSVAPPVQGRFDRSRNGENIGNVTIDDTGFVTSVAGRQVNNPILQVNETVNNSFQIFGFASAYLQYEIAKGLKFKSSISFNYYQNQAGTYFPKSFGIGRLRNGLANINNFNQSRWQYNNTLTYNKTFAQKHKFNVVLGTSILRSESKRSRITGSEFESDSVNLDDISGATNISALSDRQENGLLGIFGRINYSFDQRYVLNFTARTDKSSRFFPGSTQWGFFPSLGLTWNASEESFLSNIDFLSNLRFKGSVGQTGNDKIGVFQSQTAYTIDRNVLQGSNPNVSVSAAGVRNGSRDNAFFLSRVANPDLSWETTTQYDIGAELGLFNNRINIGVDLYHKDTEDLLLERPNPSQSGFSFILENVGKVQNRGIELTVKTVNVSTKDFSWNTDFNISYNQNKVISLGDQQEEFIVSSSALRSVGNDFIVREGEALGSVYGYQTDGVYQYSDFVEFDGLSNEEAARLYAYDPNTNLPKQFRGDVLSNRFTLKDGVARFANTTDSRPGVQKLKDISGPDGVPDGIVDSNDLSIIGDTNPLHYGGITNTFKYKSWDLSVAMNWKYGNDIFNKNYFPGLSTTGVANKSGIARDRWTVNNTDTELHSLRGRLLNGAFGANTDYIEDGSFLRLQNVSLGYSFPKLAVTKIGLSGLRLYAAADNLHVWTKYSGYDPDVSVSSGLNSGLTGGVDFDAYPKARTFRVGVKATF